MYCCLARTTGTVQTFVNRLTDDGGHAAQLPELHAAGLRIDREPVCGMDWAYVVDLSCRAEQAGRMIAMSDSSTASPQSPSGQTTSPMGETQTPGGPTQTPAGETSTPTGQTGDGDWQPEDDEGTPDQAGDAGAE